MRAGLRESKNGNRGLISIPPLPFAFPTILLAISYQCTRVFSVSLRSAIETHLALFVSEYITKAQTRISIKQSFHPSEFHPYRRHKRGAAYRENQAAWRNARVWGGLPSLDFSTLRINWCAVYGRREKLSLARLTALPFLNGRYSAPRDAAERSRGRRRDAGPIFKVETDRTAISALRLLRLFRCWMFFLLAIAEDPTRPIIILYLIVLTHARGFFRFDVSYILLFYLHSILLW